LVRPLLGQIELEGEHALSVNPDEWFLALTVLAEAAIRKTEHPRSLGERPAAA